MTKQDWDIIKEKWSDPYGLIKLNCDGYEVSLQAVIHKLKIMHVVWVNGYLKGAWMNGECEEGRRFYRCKESFIYKAKERANAKKHLGKAAYKRYNYDGKLKSYYMDWTSFAAFKKHIIANNKEITFIQKESLDFGQ